MRARDGEIRGYGYERYHDDWGRFREEYEWGPRKWKKYGVATCKVAGVSHRSAALQSPTFTAGNTLQLVREPNNPHDPNAIAVTDQAGLQVGYVPAHECTNLGPLLADGVEARVLVEWRLAATNERVGIVMLINRPGAVTLYQAPPAGWPPSTGRRQVTPTKKPKKGLLRQLFGG